MAHGTDGQGPQARGKAHKGPGPQGLRPTRAKAHKGRGPQGRRLTRDKAHKDHGAHKGQGAHTGHGAHKGRGPLRSKTNRCPGIYGPRPQRPRTHNGPRPRTPNLHSGEGIASRTAQARTHLRESPPPQLTYPDPRSKKLFWGEGKSGTAPLFPSGSQTPGLAGPAGRHPQKL